MSGPIHLGVNIDHVATIRQARGTRFPDPVQAAIEVEQAGADAVTLHLREDRRHIQDRDVELLKDILQTRMNLEMAVTEEMLAIAERVVPENCCLVPERREELTTEGGLDVKGQLSRLTDAVTRLQTAGCIVSLFIDADMEQLNAAKQTGAKAVEIHTGHFADAVKANDRSGELRKIKDAIVYGNELGLQVNAGHGLHYHNVQSIARINGVSELNIGHAIVARALFTGLRNAVSEMINLIRQA
ncbi:MAG: pyridoxine 5'-phosphate synthase [Gammaproteobacteria bacterium]